MPRWLRRDAAPPGQVCAIGLSGSTVAPDEAAPRAAADALRRLSASLCSAIDDVHVDRGAATWLFHESAPTARAREHVSAHAAVDRSWIDERGEGPLGEMGLAYARACVSALPAPCGPL